jgi:hypothetical protein
MAQKGPFLAMLRRFLTVALLGLKKPASTDNNRHFFVSDTTIHHNHKYSPFRCPWSFHQGQ